MPFCDVSRYEKGRGSSASAVGTRNGGIQIYYRRYGRGETKVLLIIGLAGTHDGWGPQVKGLTGADEPNPEDEEKAAKEVGLDEQVVDVGIEVCCFDNRGMGRSSVPVKKSEYTTEIMAKDALAVLDHLGWKNAHVFGHSMGAMIACKLAAMAPHRISSLALLNTTGGGYECVPKIDRQMLSLAIRFIRAKSPEERAMVDLETHYTKEYLDEHLGHSTRRRILYQQYVKGISSSGMQSSYGFEGQVNACWTHNMTSKELEVIRSAGFLVLVIHGRYDIIAQPCHARNLAHKLKPVSRMVELHGAHLVGHERPFEVNQSLLKLIRASNMKTSRHELLSLSYHDTGLSALNQMEVGSTVSTHDLMSKLQLSFLYFFGVFIMGFEHARRAFRQLKPVRVAASLT